MLLRNPEVCGLLIRRPSVRTGLGPQQHSKKQNKSRNLPGKIPGLSATIADLARRLARGELTTRGAAVLCNRAVRQRAAAGGAA